MEIQSAEYLLTRIAEKRSLDRLEVNQLAIYKHGRELNLGLKRKQTTVEGYSKSSEHWS